VQAFRSVLAAVAVAALAACSGPGASGPVGTGGVESGMLTTQAAGDGTVLQKADLDGDGSPDVWAYYREKDGRKVLVRKSVDLNSDGKPDLTQYYDDAGELQREEIDLDFDLRVDLIRRYEKGKIAAEDVSSRFDGKFDVKKYYDAGVLVLKQVDSRRNGQFDEFQYFVGSKLSRIGWDRDGDGKPEVFEENPAME
jgi:hypothetical protein